MARQARVCISSYLTETLGVTELPELEVDEMVHEPSDSWWDSMFGPRWTKEELEQVNNERTVRYPAHAEPQEEFEGYEPDYGHWDLMITPAPMPEAEVEPAVIEPADEPVEFTRQSMHIHGRWIDHKDRNKPEREGKFQIALTRSIRVLRKTQRQINQERRDERDEPTQRRGVSRRRRQDLADSRGLSDCE